MDVRPARAEDLAELSSLAQQLIAQTSCYNEAAREAYSREYDLDMLRSRLSKDIVLVAQGPPLIGFVVARPDNGVYWGDWIAVSANARREGVAEALLHRLYSELKAKRVTKLWCDSRSENHTSNAFLKKEGFSLLCLLRAHWYGQDYFLWEKNL